MLIKLIITNIKNIQIPIRHYDFDIDDIRSILTDICQFTDNICCFQISGFGQDNWPVTTNTDLPVLLEQLPKVLKDISLGNSTEIEFYEQGIERTIVFKPVKNLYELSCISQNNWQPNPKEERISTIDLIKMMSNFLENFISLAQNTAPQLVKHEWFKNWLNP
jgi:hypothetical protein